MMSCCNHRRFTITNVKLTVKMRKMVTIADNDSRVLVHETANLCVYHVNNLSLTIFRNKIHGFCSKFIHVTGTRCHCEIEHHVLETISSVSNAEAADCEFMKIGSISFTYKTCPGLKSRFLKMSPLFYQKHDVRIPRRFPALVLKKLHLNITGLLFNSGHLIGCGARRPQQIYDFIDKFNQLVGDVDRLLISEG